MFIISNLPKLWQELQYTSGGKVNLPLDWMGTIKGIDQNKRNSLHYLKALYSRQLETPPSGNSSIAFVQVLIGVTSAF